VGFQDLAWNICVKFCDHSGNGLLRYRADKQTDTQTNGGKNHSHATAVGVGNKTH